MYRSSELDWNNNNISNECGTPASAYSSRRVSRYSLVNDSPKSEEWKLSSYSPHHVPKPLPQEPVTPPKKKKALPAIPVQHYELHQPLYYEQQPLYDDAYSTSMYYSPVEPMVQEELIMPQPSQEYYYDNQQQYDIMTPLSPPVEFFPQHQITDYQVPIPPQPMESYYPYSPPSSVIEQPEEDTTKPTEANNIGYMPLQQQQPIVEETMYIKKPEPVPFQNNDKNVRQITVRSINDDYRVWITVEPKETGESIAEKIHTIATFRTRKILTVTTASGRKIALNKTPIFMHWEDMDDFENGETWSVTWGPLKKSMVDKILSKFIQV